jgi:uncharacterized protein (TIGR00369 family)
MLARIGGEGEVAAAHTWLGIRFIEASEGSLTVEMDIRPEFSNTFDVVQGGILSTIADTACAGAALTTCASDEAVATLDLHVHFVRPAAIDLGLLRASGRVLGRSGRHAHSEGEVCAPDGTLLAKATATVAIRKLT